MTEITVESLKAAGVKDPVATFTEIALAGGFGAVPPSQALDVNGITDAAAKKAVEDILGRGKKEPAK